MTDTRFVMLVLDGLRPDMVTAQTMPNLAAFRDAGAWLGNSRAQYPTQTRVNKVSFATGSTPRHHGIHFNKIHDPALSRDRFIDLGVAADVQDAVSRAPLVTSPTLGMVLAEVNRGFALIHCGASGAPFLLNYRGEEHGQHHLSMAGLEYSTPKMAELIEARMGPLPGPDGVNLDRSAFALRAFRDVIYPELRPDVTVIWSDEPDKSEHVDGLRGPVTNAAIRHADALVGEIVDWWQHTGATDDVNLLIVSDHGHVEISRTLPLARLMTEAGWPLTTDPARPGALLLPFGGVYLRDQPEQVLHDLAGWMQEQDWCGSLFTADRDGIAGIVDGTFSKALASVDHPRAPDLLFTLRRFAGDATHPYGHCLSPGTGAAAGSTHGGAHEGELRNTFFAAGPLFRAAHRSEMSGGLIDVVPTILEAYGIAQPDTMAGRPLSGLLDGGQDVAPEPIETRTVSAGAYTQHLQFRRLERRTVLEGGWTT